MKVQSETPEVAVEAIASYPESLAKVIDDVGYIKQKIFPVDKIAFSWKKMPFQAFIAREEKSVPGLTASEDELTLLVRY